MLQWMGGSRRKVTTSRKSTQKRQKQYFEQRRRQQQHQQTVGLESDAEGTNTFGKDHKNHRSLDILSLLNLSTTAKACKSDCSSGPDHLDFNDQSVKYNIRMGPPTVFTNTFTSVDSDECLQARGQSLNQLETMSPKKQVNEFVSGTPDDHNSSFNVNCDKPDHWKTFNEKLPELSVLDMLSDEGPNASSKGSPVHEAHVAFSVEGLGKVGTETPVHSPEQPCRTFSHGCLSPVKAARKLNSSKNLKSMLDDLQLDVDAIMQDIYAPDNGGSLEFPVGNFDAFSDPKQKLFTTRRNHRQFDDCSDKIKSYFGDKRVSYNHDNNHEDIWDAGSSFLDDNILDGSECDISWNNWPREMDNNYVEFKKYGKHEMTDCAFDGPLLKKRDAVKPAEGFTFIESPGPYFKHRKSENDHELKAPYAERNPRIGWNIDFRDVTCQPDWPCFVKEDERDSLSLLSEESCSSTAVRTTVDSPANAKARQGRKRHSNAFGSPENKYNIRNTFSNDTLSKYRDDIQQENNAVGSGKCTGIFNPSKTNLKSSLRSNSPFQEKIGSPNRWFSGENHSSDYIDSVFSSHYQTSKTKLASSAADVWTKDPLSEFLDPELVKDAKSSINRSGCGVHMDFSPSGSFLSEKFLFGQLLSRIKFRTSIFSKDMPTTPVISPEYDITGMPPDSSPVGGSDGKIKIQFLDLSMPEFVGKDDGKKSKFQAIISENFEPGEEFSLGENGSCTDNGRAVVASNSMDNSSNCCKEAKDEIPDSIESRKSINSTDYPEQTSSSVKIAEKSSSSLHEIEYHRDTEILPLQNCDKDAKTEGVVSDDKKKVKD